MLLLFYMKFPEPPEAVLELRRIDERWAQVDAWAGNAMSAAHQWRSDMISQCQFIQDHELRLQTRLKIHDKFYVRLNEIDSVEESFKEAEEKVKKALNREQILKYSVQIKPIIEKQNQLEQKIRQEKRLSDAAKKTERLKRIAEKKENRLRRNKKCQPELEST